MNLRMQPPFLRTSPGEDHDEDHVAPWSATGYVGRTQDMSSRWQNYSLEVHSEALPCGSYVAEELPDRAYGRVKEFLSR